MKNALPVHQGLLFHWIASLRPSLAEKIQETGSVETLIIGLGRQGIKHAGLMKEYGTRITCAVAPGKEGAGIHENIAVFPTAACAIQCNPYIAAASVWRHFSTARTAAIEAIEAGIPIIAVITEGLPLKDTRDILTAARRHQATVIGPNTPGMIFPPERIKIGMLPDIFYPEEAEENRTGPHGVTIISRSGAILYHISDALASAGIAQNGVIGIGGDGAIGATFRDLVPMVMQHPATDLVVVAGEIGGCQEELLAEDAAARPEKYPKPLVALVSGAHAPPGKTMGHAGAVMNPDTETGTYRSKKTALEIAGIPVVNNQRDLIRAVRKKLDDKTYFKAERYYTAMRQIWEAPPPKPFWTTRITCVRPNQLLVRGIPIQDIIQHARFLDAVHLLIQDQPPGPQEQSRLDVPVNAAVRTPVPALTAESAEPLSKTLARYILMDSELACFQPEGPRAELDKTLFAVGRMTAYMAAILGHSRAFMNSKTNTYHHILHTALTGEHGSENAARMIGAMCAACLDHGVTPPSIQAARIAASVRAPFEVVLSHGVGAITDVHGGAGEKAVRFFGQCLKMASRESLSPEESLRRMMQNRIENGNRIEGLGHRLHSRDPRRDVLWDLSRETGTAGPAVSLSQRMGEIFENLRGLHLPVNVDGVMGAIVADMDLDPGVAKALFILGRTAGIAAHYFEEIRTQPPMRRIDFSEARYTGHEQREWRVF